MSARISIVQAERAPLDIALAVIPSLPRAVLARLVERAIDRLDEIDGDADREEDDPSGQLDEDGTNTGAAVFAHHGTVYCGAGCPISDPDFDYLGH